ncbi:MAG TPA: TIGR03960 family B12-binding radical SAM protein, partial [Clostridia bacterium]|nr:TIGR03960 family B12-binding radical SAM protein [Clostridia bacterium]
MREQVERILPYVQKPARYTGNEWNAVKKEWQDSTVKMVFAFPDVYEVGMSYLGLQILYHIVNNRRDSLMERVFAPWVDMEEKMRERDIPLFSMESFRPISDFDIVAFTLQYELSYTNILNMLDLSGITLNSAERDETEPLVIAGGPCVYNPEPLADFIDLFVIGEGEEVIHELIDVLKIKKEKKLTRHKFLRKAAAIQGIYVPSFYEPRYDDRGYFQQLSALLPEARPKIAKRVVQNIDTVDFPTHPIVPWMEVIHDRVMLEVMRGCTRGCRFCQAGVLYRPAREKKPETLMRQAEQIVRTTGHNEISLTSLSSADYTAIQEVIKGLLNAHEASGIGVSLPSLRVDAFSVDLAKEVQRVRRSSLTFAPEAGTQRMRNVINKGVTEEDLMETVTSAFQAGWNAIKLYF